MDKKETKQEQLRTEQNQPDASVKAAAEVAEADIQKDLDLTPPKDPGDDLDEGELARLEGED